MILNVHGGTTQDEILDIFDRAEASVLQGNLSRIHVFLDEVNTCAYMGLIKEAICNRSLRGKPIHPAVQILAALNPYRLRQHQVSSGLVYRRQEAVKSQSEMENLVYRVHPIPRTLHEFVFDFGALSPDTEQLYIYAMVSARVPSHLSTCLKGITSMIAASHKYVREVEGEPSAVSLRDVKRTIDLIRWFDRCGFGTIANGSTSLQKVVPIVLAVCHVYMFRLPEKRSFFLSTLRIAVKHTKGAGECSELIEPGSIEQLLHNAQQRVVSKLVIEAGIAMNAALKENIYVTIVCILHRIPIFVVGKPGSSKTLTMQVISYNLQGDQSPSPYWRKFPSVYIFSYQCSPLSTAARIQHQYNMACNYQSSAHNTVTVLLLDEVGLAEHSPDMPLKVLHSILVDPKVSVVGLSNWTLDPAKMNRAICLQRTTPQQDEIQQTGWVISAGGPAGSTDAAPARLVRTPSGLSKTMPWLQPVAKAYHMVYTSQEGREYIGMRDYYQLVKQLLRDPDLDTDDPASCKSFSERLVFALCRNFGGLAELRQRVLDVFSNECQDTVNSGLVGEPIVVEPPGVRDLISANMVDFNARHLMILTQASAALGLLVGSGLLDPNHSSVLIGSHFEHDLSELQLVQQINKVKLAMAAGSTVVLLNHDNIYEALYDVLNQRYVTQTTVSGTRRMLRLAIGHQSQLCPVEPGFKIIAIVEEDHARDDLDLPLLNRFEKQLLLPTHLLAENQQQLLSTMINWVEIVAHEAGVKNAATVFPGLHSGTLSMLILTITSYDDALVSEDSLDKAQRTMLHMAAPVAVYHSPTLAALDNEQDVGYFEAHNNIISAVHWHRSVTPEAPLLILTHSPVSHLSAETVAEHFERAQLVRLADLTSESQLSFFAETLYTDGQAAYDTLVVQCDPALTAQPLIDHARYTFVQQLISSPCRGSRQLIFLIHLPPSRSGDTSRRYVVDVQAPWNYMFVDDLRVSDTNTPVDQLLQMTLPEILSSGSVDLEQMLCANLTSAVALCASSIMASLKGGSASLSRVHNLHNLLLTDQDFRQLICSMCMHLLTFACSEVRGPLQLHMQLACTEAACGSLRQSLHAAFETLVCGHLLERLPMQF